MSADLDQLLAAQDLTSADLEANRVGTVSAHQAALVNEHRKSLATIPITISIGLVVLALAFALYDFHAKHDATVFILPAVALGLGLGLCALVFSQFLLPKIDGEAVTLIEGPVTQIWTVSNRGGYLLRMNGVAYKGVATGIDQSLQGQLVKAYVVSGSRMVVAVTPG